MSFVKTGSESIQQIDLAGTEYSEVMLLYTTKIGEMIAQKRKEAGLTQTELAEYIGVSKAAVSKWEAGHHLPDISMLPILAAFFDMTVDELMGYRPQMTKKHIEKLCSDLTDMLSECPADDVFAECRTLIRKYYSCWELILRLCEFMYAHYMLSCRPHSILHEILASTERIINHCGNEPLLKTAGYIRVCCLIQTGDLEQAAASAEQLISPVMNTPVLLSFIYHQQGRASEAEQLILSYVEQNIQLLFTAIPDACMYSDTAEANHLIQKFSGLLTALEAERYYPKHLLRFYFASAIAYCNMEKVEDALQCLQQFVQLSDKIRSGTLHREKDCFQKAHHKTIQTYSGSSPSDMKTIFQTITEYLYHGSALDILKHHPEFASIVQKLRKMAEEYHNDTI